MKHSIKELYKVRNSGTPFLATANYIKTFNIPTDHEELYEAMRMGNTYAIEANYHISRGGVALVHDVYTAKIIYMFGEKTWFDTEEERDEYRKKYQAEREEKEKRRRIMNIIIAELDKLNTEQLQNIVDKYIGAQ